MVRGFKTPVEQKLFCLWLNSTFALLLLLEKATITGGPWVRLEQFLFGQIPVPDWRTMSREKLDEVERIYESFGTKEFPDLLDQLHTPDSVRSQLDQALLSLLGLSPDKIANQAESLRKGVFAAIALLRKAQVKKTKYKKRILSTSEI